MKSDLREGYGLAWSWSVWRRAAKRLSADTAGTVVTVVVLVLVWHFAATYGAISPYLLPSPVSVLEQIASDLTSANFYTGLGLSLYRVVASFALATVIGVSLGLLMRASRLADWFFSQMISIGLPLPKVALLPIFVVWFGLFDVSKIALTTFSAVFVIVTATLNAATKVDMMLVWSARNFAAGRGRILWDVVLPGSLSGIYTGLQIALPICLVVTFVGEMVMGGQGLGASMIVNARNADSPGVFAGIVEIAVVGNVMIGLMQAVRGRVLYWLD